MLQIIDIFKEYHTGDLVQKALDGVSLNLRDNEFVAVLGPSGSGKTTLLNIIGGLDRYDQGDLIINDVSTKEYKDKDWDSYRNHSVGFVFQNYNLIPHQSILSNVELALTISGVSKEEREQRAKEALKKVGLEEHIHKKPNQLSGGQMQRVAIARALVNDPDILLADEPTGALDSETSIQIMELLKEVAKDRLVVMVTHNPELADTYATRIVKLKDGTIQGDSNPLYLEEGHSQGTHKNLGKTFMSFGTALSLSFNNLKTKLARTFLTAFAGSIGIIGIAMILSISNGVNQYITDIQKETMVSYPVTIQSRTLDLSGALGDSPLANEGSALNIEHEMDKIYSNPIGLETASSVTSSVTENNLTSFKAYIDDPNSQIHQYLGENGVVYSYNTKFDIYGRDPEGNLVNTDGSTFEDDDENAEEQSMGIRMTDQTPGNTTPAPLILMQGDEEDNLATELIPGQNGGLISTAIIDQFDLLAGAWPTKGDEVVLVLDPNNEISTTVLYELGLLPSNEFNDILDRMDKGEEIDLETQSWNYEDLIGRVYQIIPEADYYEKNEDGYFSYIGDDEQKVEELLSHSQPISISGVIKAKDEDSASLISSPLAYTQDLTNYIITYTDQSPVVVDQEANPDINILNGLTFEPADDEVKIQDTIEYLSGLGVTQKAAMMTQILNSLGQGDMTAMMGEEQLAAYLDQYLEDPDDESLLEIYDTFISTGTYDDNLSAFGKVSKDAPSAINLYADTFEAKDGIELSIEDYNQGKPEEDQITYTDIVGLLMSSVTTVINVITWVLVAFVAVALVVSSIMIGIITYISVLERTKEIGILRSIGASKGNISEVFNAETFIIGLISGVMGIGITLLLLIPTNIIIHNLIGNTEVNASLPPVAGVLLIILSVILTLIGGFIPARAAAKKDPVTSLRTE